MALDLDIKISFSWVNYCRLCLLDKGLKIPIFDKVSLAENIAFKIKECLNIPCYDGDPLPKMICHQCLCKLNNAYELHHKALESFHLLRARLQPFEHVTYVGEYMKEASACLSSISKISNSRKEERIEDVAQSQVQVAESEVPAFQGPQREEEVYSGRRLRSADAPRPQEDERRVTRQSLAAQQAQSERESPGHQHGNTVIVPNIENPYLNSGKEEPSYLTTLVPKSLETAHINPEMQEFKDADDSGSRKRKRITEHYDQALMETGGNLVLAAGRSKKGEKKRRIGPASRTRTFTNTQSGPSPYQCAACTCYFSTYQLLRRHVSDCLTCQTCSQVFTTVDDKAVHEQTHMYVNLDNYVDLLHKCIRCDRSYSAATMLKHHIKYDHEQLFDTDWPMEYDEAENPTGSEPNAALGETFEDREWQENCDCPSDDGDSDGDFMISDDDLSNKDGVSDTDEDIAGHKRKKRVVCPQCGREFAKNRILKRHLRNHSSLVKCPLCPWMFPQRGPGKRLHLYRVHNEKQELPTYKCKMCSEVFESKSILYLHKKSHSTSTQVSKSSDSSPKKIGEEEECNLCHSMIKSSKLEEHLFQHASEALAKPSDSGDLLQCKKCSAWFPNQELLKIHTAKHGSGKGTFLCECCNQNFANVEAINRHSCPGKEPEGKKWRSCEHCGQVLSEEVNHVCDNECQKCHRFFKSSRGQRLHTNSKHDCNEAVNADASRSNVDDVETDEATAAPEVKREAIELERPFTEIATTKKQHEAPRKILKIKPNWSKKATDKKQMLTYTISVKGSSDTAEKPDSSGQQVDGAESLEGSGHSPRIFEDLEELETGEESPEITQSSSETRTEEELRVPPANTLNTNRTSEQTDKEENKIAKRTPKSINNSSLRSNTNARQTSSKIMAILSSYEVEKARQETGKTSDCSAQDLPSIQTADEGKTTAAEVRERSTNSPRRAENGLVVARENLEVIHRVLSDKVVLEQQATQSVPSKETLEQPASPKVSLKNFLEQQATQVKGISEQQVTEEVTLNSGNEDDDEVQVTAIKGPNVGVSIPSNVTENQQHVAPKNVVRVAHGPSTVEVGKQPVPASSSPKIRLRPTETLVKPTAASTSFCPDVLRNYPQALVASVSSQPSPTQPNVFTRNAPVQTPLPPATVFTQSPLPQPTQTVSPRTSGPIQNSLPKTFTSIVSVQTSVPRPNVVTSTTVPVQSTTIFTPIVAPKKPMVASNAQAQTSLPPANIYKQAVPPITQFVAAPVHSMNPLPPQSALPKTYAPSQPQPSTQVPLSHARVNSGVPALSGENQSAAVPVITAAYITPVTNTSLPSTARVSVPSKAIPIFGTTGSKTPTSVVSPFNVKVKNMSQLVSSVSKTVRSETLPPEGGCVTIYNNPSAPPGGIKCVQISSPQGVQSQKPVSGPTLGHRGLYSTPVAGVGTPVHSIYDEDNSVLREILTTEGFEQNRM